MKELSPKARKIVLASTILGAAMTANGISLMGHWGARVNEDILSEKEKSLSEDYYIQRTELNGKLLGYGGILTTLGLIILSLPWALRQQAPKR